MKPDQERRVRRVLHSGDPRGEDYRAAKDRVRDIRSRLSQLRSELRDIGKIEARFQRDRLCDEVAGTMTLALIALHSLTDGDRGFGERAERLDALWAEVARDPDGFVIEDGTTWDWHA